jgi:3D (Asp-Asp-Asp) domain-containing protein
MRRMIWNPVRQFLFARLAFALVRRRRVRSIGAALWCCGWLAVPSAAVACEVGMPLGEVVEVRTTAYTHSEASHLKYGVRNAVGGRLRYGNVRSAAADWSRYPLGTVFRIGGSPEIYEIDDYGSALVGKNTIDLYKPTTQSMRQWGVRQVEIEVIAWGSLEKSLKVLEPRARYASHVAAMVRDIRAKAKAMPERDLAQNAPGVVQDRLQSRPY